MEMWRKINDRYEVSSIGNVRSLTVEGFDSRGRVRKKTGKNLKKVMKNDGYLVVNISGETKRVHRLVAEAFLENNNNFKCVNHIDGDRSNNNLENLEWCTHSWNNHHAYKLLGREPVKNIGANNGMSRKIIDDDTGIIYDSIKSAASAKQINRRTLNAMLTGQNKNKTKMRYL